MPTTKRWLQRYDYVPPARMVLLPSELTDRQEEIERAFFASLRLKNGTYKTTRGQRLNDVNELLLRHLPRDHVLQLMDVAVSSGVATREWAEALDRAALEYELWAGDVSLEAYLLGNGAALNLLADNTGYILQFEIAGDAFPAPVGRYNLLRFGPQILWMRIANRAFRPEAGDSSLQGWFKKSGWRKQDVLLLSPRVKSHPRLHFLQDDIMRLRSDLAKMDALRAANILNESYFSPGQLRRMFENLRSRVKDNGLLLVCRTDESEVNHATLFRCGIHTVSVVDRLGGGSAIEKLVL
ncbi:MAG: hypothetical protein HYX26_09580 [Acidobacteriales bacterium]|nr:hypothetical protein [Terriglobales bacterium]